MEAEIKQAELQLAQNKQRRTVVLRRQHFIQQLFRQRFAGFIVTRDKRQRLRLPAPVFHKLTRQFDRIPRHTADTGNTSGFDAGQHMVQAVTELVEQGDHFVVVNSAGLPFTGRLKLQVKYATGFAKNHQLYASGLRSHPSTPRRACFHGHTDRGRSYRAVRYFRHTVRRNVHPDARHQHLYAL